MTRPASSHPGVLVTAVGAPPGFNALRALVETDRYRLVAADADRTAPGLYCFGTRAVVLPPASAGLEYVDALVDACRRFAVDVILPCIEAEVIAASANADRLARAGVRVLLPSPDVVARSIDKWTSWEACRRAGLDAPACRLIWAGLAVDRVREELEAMTSVCPPPWILKPRRGHGMRGVSQVSSPDEARETILAASEDLLLQERIPGRAGSIHLAGLLYDGQGVVIRRYSSRSIRTLHPQGGPATGGVTTDRADLVDASERVVRCIGPWVGPLNAEWMVDPRDGRPRFLEINPRLWGYGYLAVAAGMNFPQDTVEAALGRDPGPDRGYRVGMGMLRAPYDYTFDPLPFEADP